MDDKMKCFTVADLKSNFSEILQAVKNGDDAVIEYGRSHKKLAVIIPYAKYQRQPVKLGIMDGKARLRFKAFRLDDEDLVKS